MFLDDDEISAISAEFNHQITAEKNIHIDQQNVASPQYDDTNNFNNDNNNDKDDGFDSKGNNIVAYNDYDSNIMYGSYIEDDESTRMNTYPNNNDALAYDLSTILGSDTVVTDADMTSMTGALSNAELKNAGLKKRLLKRTKMLEDMRNAYLKDVVALKNILDNVVSGSEKQKILEQYHSNIPSLDMRDSLKLFGPKDGWLKINACETCGGHVEITIKDSDRVTLLENKIKDMFDRETRIKVQLASQDARIDSITSEKNDQFRVHSEEKRFFYSEAKRLREENEKLSDVNKLIFDDSKRIKDNNHALKQENNSLLSSQSRLKEMESELTDVKQSYNEALLLQNKLRQANEHLSNEITQYKVDVNDLKVSKDKLALELKEALYAIGEYKDTIAGLHEQNSILARKEEEAKTLNKQLIEQALKQQQELTAQLNIKTSEVKAAEIVIEKLQNQIGDMKLKVREVNDAMERNKKEVAIHVELVMEKDAIIAMKNEELMDKNLEIEGMEEEINAMTLFVADHIVARAATPANATVTSSNRQNKSKSTSSSSSSSSSSVSSDDSVAKRREAGTILEQMSGMFAEGTSCIINGTATTAATVSVGDGTAIATAAATVKPSTPVNNDYNQSNKGRAQPVRIKPVAATASTPIGTSSAGVDGTEKVLISKAASLQGDRVFKKKKVHLLEETMDEYLMNEAEDVKTYYHLIRDRSNSSKKIDRLDNKTVIDGIKKVQKLKHDNVDIDVADAFDSIIDDDAMLMQQQQQQHDAVSAEKVKKGPKVSYKDRKRAATATATAVIDSDSTTITLDETYVIAAAVVEVAVEGPGEDAPPAVEKHVDEEVGDDDSYDAQELQCIELIPPKADATQEEIMLRSSLHNSLIDAHVHPNTANLVINTTAATVASYGKLMSTALSNLWQSLLVARQSMDFLIKVAKLFDSMLRSKECETVEEFAAVITASVKTVGINIYNASMSELTEAWLASAGIDMDTDGRLIGMLLPTLLDDGTYTYSDYYEYFGETQTDQLYNIKRVTDSVNKINQFNEAKVSQMNEVCIRILLNWSGSYQVVLTVDDVIDHAKDETRQEMQVAIDGVLKDCEQYKRKYEVSKQMVSDVEVKMTSNSAKMAMFDSVVKQSDDKSKTISDLESSIVALNSTIDTQKAQYNELTKLHDSTMQRLNDSTSVISQLEKILSIRDAAIGTHVTRIQHLESIIQPITDKLAQMEERDLIRREKLVSVDVQCNASMVETSIQTEFITPGMSLRSVISTASKHMKRNRFPHSNVLSGIVDDPYTMQQERVMRQLLIDGAAGIASSSSAITGPINWANDSFTTDNRNGSSNNNRDDANDDDNMSEISNGGVEMSIDSIIKRSNTASTQYNSSNNTNNSEDDKPTIKYEPISRHANKNNNVYDNTTRELRPVISPLSPMRLQQQQQQQRGSNQMYSSSPKPRGRKLPSKLQLQALSIIASPIKATKNAKYKSKYYTDNDNDDDVSMDDSKFTCNKTLAHSNFVLSNDDVEVSGNSASRSSINQLMHQYLNYR